MEEDWSTGEPLSVAGEYDFLEVTEIPKVNRKDDFEESTSTFEAYFISGGCPCSCLSRSSIFFIN